MRKQSSELLTVVLSKKATFIKKKIEKTIWMVFKKKYFSEKWSPACESALKVYARLRHRNAHPDWLTTPNGVLSKEELKQSTKDLVLLSRFYGYMILALAGFKDLESLFPIVRFGDDV